jgi:site-specific DNA recombinase
MIAAIYARKSTDQNVVDEQKSVARQIEHAKAYATRKGWAVADDYVYSDDGISGAEFKKRPGFLRLLNALSPRPPFQVLIMSEESRLGREAIETGYVLKQIMDAGVRVYFYLEDRERTLDTAMDKVMLSLTNFAAEMEREKARQRTYDAMLRKARALHVTGGKVYGYTNVDVLDGAGQRVHITRRINADEAAVVRRIFEMYALGVGTTTIGKTLNAEHVKPPRGRGWAPSGVREMLYRPLYRGEIVWNKSQKIVKAGTKSQRRRPKDEWITLPAPELQIVSPELAAKVDERLSSASARFPRTLDGRKLMGRPRFSDESAYLLTGFTKCTSCGGPVGTDLRGFGRAGSRRHVPYYVCLDYKRRGTCTNAVALQQDILDRALLGSIAEVLDVRILDRAVDEALARLRSGREKHLDRRTQVERELSLLVTKMDRLMDALAEGTGPKEEIIVRLNEEKQRKTVLAAELTKLSELAGIEALDETQLKRELHERVADVKTLLEQNTTQARQMLRKLLAGSKIEMEGFGEGRERGYKFRGDLSIGKLITGGATNTSHWRGPISESAAPVNGD